MIRILRMKRTIPMPPKGRIAFMAFSEYGMAIMRTASSSRRECIDEAMRTLAVYPGMSWKYYYKQGWRVHRVRVEPVTTATRGGWVIRDKTGDTLWPTARLSRFWCIRDFVLNDGDGWGNWVKACDAGFHCVRTWTEPMKGKK